jgi:hypothetical protein
MVMMSLLTDPLRWQQLEGREVVEELEARTGTLPGRQPAFTRRRSCMSSGVGALGTRAHPDGPSGLSGGAGQGGWRGAGEAGCGRQGVVSPHPPHPARQGATNTGTPDGPDGRVHPASQAPTVTRSALVCQPMLG